MGTPPRFGRYDLLEEIARGGMGIVYRARDTQDGSIRALKVMIEADEHTGLAIDIERLSLGLDDLAHLGVKADERSLRSPV